ncbi:hypothetical protein BRADI_1g28447v3 [Brachypodium distachyon]|uniref:No apical meristem-associated C-terminal domain-containing protein n=1 Tax=Brachypodium distachyon TaxID=15368 RepID=A0A2K2DLN6_BRADI|nr:hypothetical protein BRADI_1g28447v3 [Brachypodium distachyon]
MAAPVAGFGRSRRSSGCEERWGEGLGDGWRQEASSGWRVGSRPAGGHARRRGGQWSLSKGAGGVEEGPCRPAAEPYRHRAGWGNGQVAEEYNKNSPANEIRSVSQCKGHWSKTTPLVSLFHACYIKTKNVYASGQSKEGLMEKTLKEEAKWRNLYMEEDLGGKRHKLDASGAYTSSSAADSEGTDRVREPRPQGTKAAKEARKLKGKVKAKAKDISDFVPFHISEESSELLREGHGCKAAALEKWAEATTAKAGADKEMAEVEKEMAKARKERTKVDIFNTYMELLKVDTSGFNDAQMQRHEKMVENLCNKLD